MLEAFDDGKSVRMTRFEDYRVDGPVSGRGGVTLTLDVVPSDQWYADFERVL